MAPLHAEVPRPGIKLRHSSDNAHSLTARLPGNSSNVLIYGRIVENSKIKQTGWEGNSRKNVKLFRTPTSLRAGEVEQGGDLEAGSVRGTRTRSLADPGGGAGCGSCASVTRSNSNLGRQTTPPSAHSSGSLKTAEGPAWLKARGGPLTASPPPAALCCQDPPSWTLIPLLVSIPAPSANLSRYTLWPAWL